MSTLTIDDIKNFRKLATKERDIVMRLAGGMCGG